MSIIEILTAIHQSSHAGSVVAVLVILGTIIEISPIKISPLNWIGKRVNKELEDRIDDMDRRLVCMDGKLNNHMVESYRGDILEFADRVMAGQKFTLDKWRSMLRICSDYEHMIEDEGLINGDATQAIIYINQEYQACCQTGNFAGFPKK